MRFRTKLSVRFLSHSIPNFLDFLTNQRTDLVPGFTTQTLRQPNTFLAFLPAAFGSLTAGVSPATTFLANCFCPNGWVQLSNSYNKPTKVYAECLRLSFTDAAWFAASLSCPMLITHGRAFLASELSSLKHQFHEDYVRKVRGIAKPYQIGLSYNETTQGYVWEETYANGTNKQVSVGN